MQKINKWIHDKVNSIKDYYNNSSKISIIKTIKNNNYIHFILKLKDGRIIFSQNGRNLNILEPSNDYKISLSFQADKWHVTCLCEISENIIAASGGEQSIKIWDLHNNSYKLLHTIYSVDCCSHTNIVLLSNKRLLYASISNVKIWKWKDNYIFDLIKVIQVEHCNAPGFLECLLYIDYKDIALFGKEESLQIWNMKDIQLITTIQCVGCFSRNSMSLIDKARVVVGGRNGICIININTMEIEDRLNYENIFVLCCIRISEDSIICGRLEGRMLLYNMRSHEYCIIRGIHNKDCSVIIKLEDNLYMSAHQKIRIWKYNMIKKENKYTNKNK